MPPHQSLNIVILGGSYAGLAVAHAFLDNYLVKLNTFDGAHSYNVVLVSPSTHLYWNICTPRALVSENLIAPEETFVPIEPAFERHQKTSWKFVQGCATTVDFSKQEVVVELVGRSGCGRSDLNSKAEPRTPRIARGISHPKAVNTKVIPYHALVIATGTSSNSPLFSLHGTHEDTLAELASFHRQLAKAHSVLIVGGGPTGVETAGQLSTYYNPDAQRRRDSKARATQTTDANAVIRAYDEVFGSRENGREKLEQMPNRKSKDVSTTSNSASIIPRERHIKRNIKRDSAMSGVTATTTAQSIAQSKRSQNLSPPIPKTITLISGHPRLLPKHAPKVSKKAEKLLRKSGVHIVHGTRQICHTTNKDGASDCMLNNGITVTSDVLIEATGVSPNTKFLPQQVLDRNGYVITETSTLRVYGRHVGQRVYAVGDCAHYSKNCILDVYDAIPVLVRNLLNDLLDHEYKLQTVTSTPTNYVTLNNTYANTKSVHVDHTASIHGISNFPPPRLPEPRREKMDDKLSRAVSTARPVSPGPGLATPKSNCNSSRSTSPTLSSGNRSPTLAVPLRSPMRTSHKSPKRDSISQVLQPQLRAQTPENGTADLPRTPPSSPVLPHSATTTNNPSSTPHDPATYSLRRRPLLTSAEAHRKFQALQDAHYTPRTALSEIMPITRYGGVGILMGHRVPGFMVHLLKGRGWRMGKMREVVERGENPFGSPRGDRGGTKMILR